MKYIIDQTKQWFSELNIISMILGGILSFLIAKTKDAIKNYFTKRKYHKIVNNDILLAPKTITSIDHSAPWYEDKHINIFDSGKQFYLKPRGIKPISKDYAFNKETFFNKKFEEFFKSVHEILHIDYKDLKEYLKECELEVVEDAKQSRRNGFSLFNGKLCGISNIECGFENETEKSQASIAYYTTDYYTHSVMNKLYRKLLHDQRYAQYFPKEWHCEDINNLHPFFTSIGVDALLFVDLDLSQVIIAKRSKILPNMKSKNKSLWHVSMNESVIPTDLNNSSTNLSLRKCAVRGLHEELGIDTESSNDVKIKFGEFFFVQELCEVGVTCAITIPTMTFNQVLQKKQIAKDEKEHVDLRALKPSELKKEIKDNGDDFTEACKYTAAMLLERYEEIKKLILK